MPGIDNRKDILILLLAMPGRTGSPYEPIAGRTRLMKLLFLLDKDQEIRKHIPIADYYSFEPYHYGPFSKDVFDDLDFLRNVGIVESATEGPGSYALRDETEKLLDEQGVPLESGEVAVGEQEERFMLTNRGRTFYEEKLSPSLPPSVRDDVVSLKSELGSVPLSSLLRYVYRRFPDSAKNSKLNHLTS
jgi:uncharacterized protein YwgA